MSKDRKNKEGPVRGVSLHGVWMVSRLAIRGFYDWLSENRDVVEACRLKVNGKDAVDAGKLAHAFVRRNPDGAAAIVMAATNFYMVSNMAGKGEDINGADALYAMKPGEGKEKGDA